MKDIFSKIFSILFLFIILSCSQNYMTTKYNKKNSDYKTCLSDANDNITMSVNINQDRIDMLQNDDTMIDFYNINNDIDEIKLSQKRNEMIDDCMKSRKKN